MKRIFGVLMALLLAGCAAVPAETEPVEVSGTLTVTGLQDSVQVDCNGQTMEIGPVHGMTEDFFLDCARVTVLGEQALKITFGETCFLFLGDMTREEQRALAEEQGQLSAQVLQLSGEPAEELLAAVEPTYILTPEDTEEAWSREGSHFSFERFGPVTVESDGATLNLSWSLHVSHDVASAAE